MFSKTLIAQLRQIQAKLNQHTIGSKTPTDRVDSPVWESPQPRSERNVMSELNIAEVIETLTQAGECMAQFHAQGVTFDMARYSYANHHKCTLGAATDAIENLEFITKQRLPR